jgi:hypothetical protein
MAVNFPNTPSINQTYGIGDRSWIWTGTFWKATSGGSVTNVYDLDDVSYAIDGYSNTFYLTYNQSAVTIVNPFQIMVTVNGAIQPAFLYNYDTVWLSNTLTASKGYTIDATGRLKFADCPPTGAQIMIRTVVSGISQSAKIYPFKPIDIMLGY